MVFSAFQVAKSSRFALRLIFLVPLAAGLGGCASQFPVLDGIFPSSDPMITGSTTDVPQPFASYLAREDWLMAETSLEAALDPANLDTSTEWQQKTGRIKGSFRPVGLAFTKDGTLCRDFTARVEKQGQEPQLLAATACRFGAGPWLVRGPSVG